MGTEEGTSSMASVPSGARVAPGALDDSAGICRWRIALSFFSAASSPKGSLSLGLSFRTYTGPAFSWFSSGSSEEKRYRLGNGWELDAIGTWVGGEGGGGEDGGRGEPTSYGGYAGKGKGKQRDDPESELKGGRARRQKRFLADYSFLDGSAPPAEVNDASCSELPNPSSVSV